MRIIGAWAVGPRNFSVIKSVTAEKLPYRAYRRRALGGAGDVLGPDAAALGIDLTQHDQHLLGDDVARDALAFGLELVHVDPHGIKRGGAPGDDAGMQQRLDQDAEDVGALFQLGAAGIVA